MKLTFEQIVSCANGIIRVEQNELGLELHRFTREQEGFFIKRIRYFARRAFLTVTLAGIADAAPESLWILQVMQCR